jgi:hypothetical protein
MIMPICLVSWRTVVRVDITIDTPVYQLNDMTTAISSTPPPYIVYSSEIKTAVDIAPSDGDGPRLAVASLSLRSL